MLWKQLYRTKLFTEKFVKTTNSLIKSLQTSKESKTRHYPLDSVALFYRNPYGIDWKTTTTKFRNIQSLNVRKGLSNENSSFKYSKPNSNGLLIKQSANEYIACPMVCRSVGCYYCHFFYRCYRVPTCDYPIRDCCFNDRTSGSNCYGFQTTSVVSSSGYGYGYCRGRRL